MAVVLIVIVSVLMLLVTLFVCYKMLPLQLQGESTHGYEKECGDYLITSL